MPALLTNRRNLAALLSVLCALCLLASMLPWFGIGQRSPLLRLLFAVSAGGLVGSLMLWWAPALLDTAPRKKTWRILLEGIPPLVLYMLSMEHWPEMVAAAPSGAMRVAAALVPALLVLWACVAFVRYVRMLDELQQRLELVALGLAAGLVSVAGAAAGFLHSAGMVQLPGDAAIWAFPLLLVAYSLIRTALTRRYQ